MDARRGRLTIRGGRRAATVVVAVGVLAAAVPASAVDGTAEWASAPTGVADPDSADAEGLGLSGDGRRIFFVTDQRLTPDDTDTNREDIYERSGGVTSLVSAPSGVADPNTAGTTYERTSQDLSLIHI